MKNGGHQNSSTNGDGVNSLISSRNIFQSNRFIPDEKPNNTSNRDSWISYSSVGYISTEKKTRLHLITLTKQC